MTSAFMTDPRSTKLGGPVIHLRVDENIKIVISGPLLMSFYKTVHTLMSKLSNRGTDSL